MGDLLKRQRWESLWQPLNESLWRSLDGPTHTAMWQSLDLVLCTSLEDYDLE